MAEQQTSVASILDRPSATVITIQELSRAMEVRLNGVESALVALEITVASLVKAKSIDEDEAGKVEAAKNNWSGP